MAGAIIVAASLGAFRSGAIIGPRRLDPDESPRVLLVSLGFALTAWATCVLLFGLVHQNLIKRQHLPPGTDLSDSELVLYSGGMDIAVFSAILFSANAVRRNPIRRLGLSLRRIPTGVIAGAFTLLLIFPFIIFLGQITEWVLNRLHKSPPPHELLQILSANPPSWLRIADVLAACVAAPFAEETLFRGLLQTFLRSIFKSAWPAIVLASIAFALLHPPWTWPQIFFLGLCLGYVYERSGNLWMTISIHALFNLTSIYVFTHFS
jgi:membrane protease YdiL (CAAX protease family)